MPKYFVVSGNHNQFVDWRKRNFSELFNSRQIENLFDIVYVSGVHVLKGTSNPSGIFIGTWYKRADMKEILIQLQVSISRGNKKILAVEKAWTYLQEPA